MQFLVKHKQWIQNKIQLITIRNEIQDEKTEGHHDQKIDGEQHQEETENWATRNKSENWESQKIERMKTERWTAPANL